MESARLGLDAWGIMTRRIADVLAEVRGERILHVGCADALETDSANWLHGRIVTAFPDATVVGLDIDPDAVETLRARGYCNIVHADAETMRFGTQFDTIVAGEVIEHLSNPGLFLESAASLLRPDGRLIITTPYIFGLCHFLRAALRFPRTASNPEHSCWFCPSTLTELARREGFQVNAFTLTESHPEGVGSWRLRLFNGAMKTIGRVLPRRLRSNRMLFVLMRAASAPQ